MSSSTNEPGEGSPHDDGTPPPYPSSNPYQDSSGPVPPSSQYPQAHQGQYPEPYQGQYPPPAYYQGQYQPAYMMPPAAPKNLSITSLVLGVASLMGFAFFLVPQVLAVIFGHLALKREPEGKGMAIGGLVMGYLCIAGWLAVVLLYVGLIGVMLNTTNEMNNSFSP